MIAKKNRMPHVQSRMINMQHITEAEATVGQEVALTRIPPGAVILGGSLEVVEAFSAGTIAPLYVGNDGTELALLIATAVNSTGVPTPFTGGPIRSPQGGWIKATCTGSDNAADGGDVVITTEYVVDGRWTEVMPEAGTAPEDVAS